MRYSNHKRSKLKYNFEWWKNLSHLFFPNICVSCGQSLTSQERTICISCLYKLPKTNFHKVRDNPVFNKFAGRIQVNDASSYLFFSKGNPAQALLHQLKYKGRQDIGERLGAMYGKDLMRSGYPSPDIIVPLPLHPAKQRIRGFNQSHSIARGLAVYLGSEIDYHRVVRRVNNRSQTTRGRYERWENVENIFEVTEKEYFADKHVLIVDDVVTTGSTLEACGHALLKAHVSKLSLLTIATA